MFLFLWTVGRLVTICPHQVDARLCSMRFVGSRKDCDHRHIKRNTAVSASGRRLHDSTSAVSQRSRRLVESESVLSGANGLYCRKVGCASGGRTNSPGQLNVVAVFQHDGLVWVVAAGS